MSNPSTAPVLAVQNLSRRFPGVLALDNVSFDILTGEVHALVGENGAGKSTLINILAGVHQPSVGQVLLDQRPVIFPDPLSSQRAGISVIFQEFSLLPHLSVAENVFINREPRRGLLIDWATMNRQTSEILQTLNLEIDPTTRVSELMVSQQQLVEIGRALSAKTRVIIMDEPTAALNEREAVRLLEIVRSLAASGVSVLYVSHRLEEVFSIADRITVLRDGRHVVTERRSGMTEQQVVSAMVGRELIQSTRPNRIAGPIVLQARDVSVDWGLIRNVSFSLRRGEVLGLSGLMGSGCSQLMEALYGLREITAGSILFEDRPLRMANPRAAIRTGVGLLPEDRKRQGLCPDLTVAHNLTIGAPPRWFRAVPGILDLAAERCKTLDYKRQLNIRFRGPNQRISGLSGGNQQKVILARALAGNCRALLLAEPTRGVDVGAKAEIYALIDRLVEKGIAIILQTSELPELLRLADRCIVFAGGKPQGELRGSEITQEKVMELATGLSRRATDRQFRNRGCRMNRFWKDGSPPQAARPTGPGRQRVATSQVGLILLIVGAVFSVLAPRFLNPGNLLNICTSASVVAIVGLGMTLAIASGNFDLSVGSTAALAGCVTMSLVQQIGVVPAILAGLATGAAVGLINGLIVTELRVPAFIATLGMLTIVRGAALIYTRGRDIYLYGQTQYKILSSGFTPVLLALAVALVLWLVLQHTRFGRHILATGSNPASAQRVGVRTSFVLLGVFSIVGIAAALSGLILSAQVLTGNGRLATGLELSAIAVVVLGGTPLTGGKASILGTLQGSVLVAVINNGLNLLNVSIFYQDVTLGLLLLAALGLAASYHRRIKSV